MTESALLSLSRAGCSLTQSIVAGAASPALRAGHVEVLLCLEETGPLRHAELAQRLGRSVIQPVSTSLRRQGLLTLAGAGRLRRLELTARGTVVAKGILAASQRRWVLLCDSHGPANATLAVNALRELVPWRGSDLLIDAWPSDLLTLVTHLTQDLVRQTLRSLGRPGWTEAPLRPMLLLLNGPADTFALAGELGIGQPALNLALTIPRRQGLIQRGPIGVVSLTDEGRLVSARLDALSNAPWTTLEERFGPMAAATTARIVADLGHGAPTRART